MKKLREKVSYQLFQDEDFKTRLNRCVWNNQLEPDEFEEQWGKIMTDYQLVEHEWFSDLYDLREQWIPAYFKDVSMSGLMRVTSRSESENSFFDRFLTPHLTLVEFWVCYESALEAQRHKQSKLNSDNKHSEIPRKTKSNLEVHASEMHCLWILHNQDFQKIPEQYITQRWTKAAMSKPVFDKDGKLIDVSQKFSDRKSLSTELWQEVYSCVSVAECDDNDMKLLIEKLRDIRLDMISNRSAQIKISAMYIWLH
ncbi:protein FAR1-RELATED SEQUENCE 5-like [Silene latifolia]|uniref:protein FAR1-RELATED SEQUENCE 5-like n=1 Tax=Silene latifolia TaxID=37657 RepID=UPI003D786C00